MLIQEIYNATVAVLLEPFPPGLQLGLLTNQQFLDYYVDVCREFLNRTEIVKKIDCIVGEFGISAYTLDDWADNPNDLFYDNRYLFKSAQGELDDSFNRWIGSIGPPMEWTEDRVGMKNFNLNPAPNRNGDVLFTAVKGFFGTISKVTAGDINVTFTKPMFGTIASAATGSVYLETAGPMLGTIGELTVGNGNITAFVSANLFNPNVTLNSFVELIFDTFTPYILYGILAKVWSVDGELRSDLLSKYAASRFEEGALLCKAIMTEWGMEDDIDGQSSGNTNTALARG